MDMYHVIKRALVTEKSNVAKEMANAYAFEVARAATKHDIKRAVEELFKVRVTRVNTQNLSGKPRRTKKGMGRTPDVKKAVVQLKTGDKIEIVEGV